jgi:hypothetical protein
VRLQWTPRELSIGCAALDSNGSIRREPLASGFSTWCIRESGERSCDGYVRAGWCIGYRVRWSDTPGLVPDRTQPESSDLLDGCCVVRQKAVERGRGLARDQRRDDRRIQKTATPRPVEGPEGVGRWRSRRFPVGRRCARCRGPQCAFLQVLTCGQGSQVGADCPRGTIDRLVHDDASSTRDHATHSLSFIDRRTSDGSPAGVATQVNRSETLSRRKILRMASPKSPATEITSTLADRATGWVSTLSVMKSC